MPFKAGHVANPGGRQSGQDTALIKIRKAIERGIDGLRGGKHNNVGVVRLGEMITEELELSTEPSKVIKNLAPLLPKEVSIHATTGLQELTDDELATIVASRARERRLLEAKADTIIIEDNQDVTG